MRADVRSADSSEIVGGDLEQQQKLLTKVSFVFAQIMCAYTILIFSLMPGITPAKFVLLFACILLTGISWLSQYRRWYRASATGIVVVTLLAGLFGSITNGGIEGYVAPILITAPLAAALFLGTRATMFAAAACVCAYCLLAIFGVNGWISPTAYSAQVTSIAALILLVTATLVCAAGLAYFSSESEDRIKRLTIAKEELSTLAGELHRAAHHDALTGIANRSKLSKRLEAIISDQDGSVAKLCMIHIDLDKFKSVNDTHGHPVGDGVLQKVANIMRNSCDIDDVVARIGGDEFIILKSFGADQSTEHLQAFCNELIAHINRPMVINGVDCRIGASIGFVLSDIEAGMSETLYTNADMALYEAKRSGRGRAFKFTSAMREAVIEKRALIDDIERAFREDRISCVLQPQVSLTTGEISSIEALGRIVALDGKVLTPNIFLDVLEDINLISEFDHEVMCLAFDALLSIRAAGYHIPHVSINASASSLRSDTYVRLVKSELAKRGLSHSDVIVEVLESIFIEDSEDLAARTIAELTACGIKTVMDDFGSGHASISSLLQLKVSGIKVDRALTRNITDARAQNMMDAVLNLANGMMLPPVIEGIETPRQHKILQELGCEFGQGYGFCRPKSLGEILDWLSDQQVAENVQHLPAAAAKAS